MITYKETLIPISFEINGSLYTCFERERKSNNLSEKDFPNKIDS